MSNRKIIVVSTTKSTPKEFYSEATTWRQLQDALTSDFGNVSAMRAVVKETKNDLASGEASLPQGAFTLFLTPKQIKAGSTESQIRLLERLKEKWVGAIDEIIEELEEEEEEQAEYNPQRSSYGAQARPVQPSVSYEDRQFLEKLKNGLI